MSSLRVDSSYLLIICYCCPELGLKGWEICWCYPALPFTQLTDCQQEVLFGQFLPIHPCLLSLDQMCLPVCFANLASSFSQPGHLAQIFPSHSVSFMTFTSIGFCILSVSSWVPSEATLITLKEEIIVTEAFALYIKIKKNLLLFPKVGLWDWDTWTQAEAQGWAGLPRV